MNPATIQLIIALLPLAEKLIFKIGSEVIELNTANLTKSEDIVAAFDKARADGFPSLSFGQAP